MQLRVIDIDEDKTNEMYSSTACQQVLTMYEEYYPKIGFHLPWVGYLVIRQDNVVGCCGFTGQPKNGRVEIAYWTFKEFEGQGIASFSCKELISISKQTDPTITVIAKTAPEHNASTKILQNNGFVFSETIPDEEIGEAWLWILKASKMEIGNKA